MRRMIKKYYYDHKIDFEVSEILNLSPDDLRLRINNLAISFKSSPVSDSNNQSNTSKQRTIGGNKGTSIRQDKYKATTQSPLPFSKTTPYNTHRYSMNFTLTPEYSATNGLKQYLALIVDKMKKYCPKLKLVTWQGNKIDDPITDLNKVPNKISQLQRYFDNARPHDSGGFVFTKIRVAFPADTDRATFEVDLKA